MNAKQTQKLVLLSILTALTVVLGYLHLPTPTGFVTLLDAGVFFTAFYLGRREGALVGGLSALLLDLLLGYPQWAFFSLLFHGAQGYFAGWSGKYRILGLFLASLAMIGGYFAASVWMYTIAEASVGIPTNATQNFVGLVVGFILAKAMTGVRKVEV